LRALDEIGVLPDRYLMLDLSADLMDRQRSAIAALPAHVQSRVRWLDALPDGIEGVVLGNEVLDAIPVHLITWTEDGPMQRGVAWEDNGFAWRDRPLEAGPLSTRVRALAVESPYVSEISLGAPALIQSLAQRMKQGVLLFVDYGFGADEYYHPQRQQGTLMCHYRHFAHADPFHLPGLQDITAHVDFTAVAAAGVENGLRLAGYTSQGRFLANLGITDILAKADASSQSFARVVAPVQKLMSPAEMGELFKVIALSKAMDTSLLGFSTGSLDRLL
jgi:SAM-dependent MidA family methyltransferase